MPIYVASMMHGRTGGQAVYEFDAKDKLLNKTPVRVVRTFFEHADHDILQNGHIDYEINVAFLNADYGVVTAMGNLHNQEGMKTPFMLMIHRKDAQG